jgi:DedD protein
MTDDPEGPVHYQISVTGRQAASFFLTLLVSLGVAFFFGMKAGQAASRGTDASARSSAAAEPAVQVAPAVASEGEKTKGAAPAPEAGEKKLGFDDGPPKDAEAVPARPEKPAEKVADKFAEKKAVEPTRPQESAPSAEASPPAPVAKKEAPKKDSRKETAGPFFVQLLATKEPEAADVLVKKLKEAGGFRNPDVSPVPGKAGTFRVRVGPYPDRASAEKAVSRLKKEKRSADPSIVKADKP